MSTLSLRLPDSLHRRVKELAARDDISINQFIATAVAEKMSALQTLDYLEARARRGDRTAYARALARVPDRAPIPGDEWPPVKVREPVSRPSLGRRKGGRSRARRA
ncbi:MAG TPA: toxin-antitoxin system HicB family antitoxin [Gemmatimonadales bacterium]|jgi:predicted transcriptional regulator|nr:toxin-antitoxin system HicB family antitoxin [Gemmatimonadales bacterium]